MQEARHHFLSGAGFAQQEDCGVRGRHFRCLLEHLLPWPRFADDPAITGPYVQLIRKFSNLRIQLFRPFLSDVKLSRLLRKAEMRQRER